MFITGCFYCVGENMFMFPLTKPSAFWIGCTALLCFYFFRNLFLRIHTTSTSGGWIISVFFLQRFLPMGFPVFYDFFLELFFIPERLFMGHPFSHFFTVCACLNMSGIYKNLLRIYQVEFHAVLQYLCEDLLKKTGIFKTASIILSKGRKMRNRIHHIQPQKPAIRNIYFDLSNRLPHTFNPVKVLDKRNFDQHNRIHTRSSIIRAVFFFHKIINKSPVNGFINQTQHMVLWNHVIHTEHDHLFSFLICIFSHHKKHRLSDNSIIPEKRL